MDEVTMGLIYPLLKCWTKKGKQKRLTKFDGEYKSQVLAGVLNWCTEQVDCLELDGGNSEAVIGFFEWLFNEIYPDEKLVIVMDNASFHHSYAVQAALSLYEHRVLIMWLPKYSPDLNPIERFWKHPKANACANYLYETIEQLLGNVGQVIEAHNQFDPDLHLSFSK